MSTSKSAKHFIALFFLLSFMIVGRAQNKLPEPYGPQPELGKPMPDFTLNNITYYPKTQASLKTFSGKWLILDFWSLTCSSCISNFPELNRLQETFGKDIQFLLVGLNSQMMTLGHGKRIQPLYEKLRKNMNLKLASAYDSSMFIRWGIWTIPQFIVIDPNGIVKKMTTGGKLTEEELKNILSGREINQVKYPNTHIEYDITKFPGSENNKLIYRSILTRANGEEGKRDIIREFVEGSIEDRKDGIMFAMQPLYRLYQSAYYGTWFDWTLIQEMKYPMPILETSDSISFKYNYQTTDFDGLYNYNLAVPLAKSKDLQYIMTTFQNDLKTAFGFNASLEKRSVPVWILKAKPGAAEKLKTKGQKNEKRGKNETPYIGLEFKDIPIEDLIKTIWGYHQKEPPVIDQTGINGTIDITIEGLILDFNQLKQSLEKNGLELIKGQTLMEAIVIRDRVQ